jgi:hypothetical protein
LWNLHNDPAAVPQCLRSSWVDLQTRSINQIRTMIPHPPTRLIKCRTERAQQSDKKHTVVEPVDRGENAGQGASFMWRRSARSGSIRRPVGNVVSRYEASPTAHIRERPASIGWIRWRSRYSSAPSRDTAISCAIDAISASPLCDDSRTHMRLPADDRPRGRVDERKSTLFLHSPKPPQRIYVFFCGDW